MFYDSGYPSWVFDKVLNRYRLPLSTQYDDVPVSKKFSFDVTYVGKLFLYNIDFVKTYLG